MDRPRKVHRRIPNIVESHFGNRVRESETADPEYGAAPCSQGCFDVTDAFHSSVWSPVREYQAAENLESEFQAIGFKLRADTFERTSRAATIVGEGKSKALQGLTATPPGRSSGERKTR
jgi:hypothetical protein